MPQAIAGAGGEAPAADVANNAPAGGLAEVMRRGRPREFYEPPRMPAGQRVPYPGWEIREPSTFHGRNTKKWLKEVGQYLTYRDKAFLLIPVMQFVGTEPMLRARYQRVVRDLLVEAGNRSPTWDEYWVCMVQKFPVTD